MAKLLPKKKKREREREHALKKTEAGWYTEDLCLEPSDTVGLLGGCDLNFSISLMGKYEDK